MAQIKIYGDIVKGCIFFDGSTVEPKFLGTILAEVKSDESDRIIIYRTDRQTRLGGNRELFKRLNINRVQNEAGEDLVTALGYTITQVVDYINEQANLTASVNPVADTSLNGIDVDFKLDATSTTIILDNGYQYGVNSIKAVDTGDGLITIKSIEDARVLFTQLDHTKVDVNGLDAVGGLNDVINVLNELFTVGAFESVVVSDPYSTMVADVNGIDAGYTLEGADAIDPIGDDIFTYDGTGYANYAGLKSIATINQSGEYYTFDIRGEGTIGFGLVHTQASFDAGLYSGNVNYANPVNFAAINSAHYGVQFSHWFHATPNGSWTNYGANTTYSMRAGWSNFNGTDEQADWLAGNPIKVRCGIDDNGYISIETLRNGSTWEVHARSGYPVPQGSSYHLGIKSQSTSARVFSAPKVHLLAVDDSPVVIGDTNVTLLGDAIGSLNGGIATASGTNYDNGFITEEGLDASGEYFEFEVNLGSNHTVSLVNADSHSVATIAADTSIDLIDDYAYFGQPINNLGAVTLNQHNWSGISAIEGNRFVATHFRIGFDNQGKLTVWSSTDGTNFIVSKYLSSASINGDYRLMYIGRNAGATFESLSKGQLAQAPTMYFRYIESPDGVFHYPLFTTAEEAEYYDEIVNGLTAGTGSSHTHTYNDDPTNATWYMPEATHDTATYQHNSAPDGTETFSGNAVAYTEITSLTNSSFVPSQFSSNDITQEEGTNVNLQVTPAGASWSTSVTITPSGSGLVYDGYSVIQGTLTDVGADTTYTITVTRANSYGSTSGSMTITATDVAPVQTNDTAWTKAIDFSGSSEYLKHNSGNATPSKMPLGLSSGTYIAKNSNPLYTASSSSSRPWAQTIVFKADGNNSLQCIWNNGEGFYNSSDNFGLEIDANNTLWFYYGQGSSTSANYNKCYVQIGIDTSKWYGVYIAHKGGRLSGNDATKANLGECFDIRVMSSADSFTSISPNRSGANSGGNWQVTGRRMDKSVNGMYTIGATAASQKPFYGKVASSVITTLKNNSLAPVEAEIKTMITDPIKWEADYKQGTTFRAADSSSTASVPSVPSVAYQYATQIHLMGDSIGIYPYSNNDAYPDIFNNLRWYTSTKMIMQNMVSNDIETVNINGLT